MWASFGVLVGPTAAPSSRSINVPQDFKDVYHLVTAFRHNVFTFKPGDPHKYREKIANLLYYLYGVENPDLRARRS